MMELYNRIPIFDISPINKSSDLEELTYLAKKLYSIYSTVGFAYIVNHSIQQTLFDDIFEQSKLFHALPEAEKIKIKQNEFFRGYMPMSGSAFEISTLGKTKEPNKSAAFILAHEVEESDLDYQKGINLAGPNQWPSSKLLPNFKDTLLNYRKELTVLARKMVRLFSLALGQNYESLDPYFKKPTTFLRLQYYPSQQTEVNREDQYGIAPHTDYGFLTLLVQDDVGGLQVLNKEDGSWIDVPPLRGSIILNSGDMLRRLSNKIISTPHRVINLSTRERYSIPFFFEPDMHAIISPIEVSETDGDNNESFEYADYLMQRIKANYNIGAKDKHD